jgi:hypothetical protein
MGSECIDQYFLDLGTSWRWVVNFTPRPLYPRGRSPRYLLDRRLGGPQSQSGRFGEEKTLDANRTRTPTPRSFYTDYGIPAHLFCEVKEPEPVYLHPQPLVRHETTCALYPSSLEPVVFSTLHIKPRNCLVILTVVLIARGEAVKE